MNFETSLNKFIRMEERRPSLEKRQPSDQQSENDTVNPANHPQGDDFTSSRTTIQLNNSHHFLPPTTVNGRGCIHNTRKLVFSFKNLQVPSAGDKAQEPEKIAASDASNSIRRNSLQRQASTSSNCSMSSSNSTMAECYVNAQVKKASPADKPNPSNNPADSTSALRQNMREEL